MFLYFLFFFSKIDHSLIWCILTTISPRSMSSNSPYYKSTPARFPLEKKSRPPRNNSQTVELFLLLFYTFSFRTGHENTRRQDKTPHLKAGWGSWIGKKKRNSRAKIKIRETCPPIIKSLTKSTNLTAITSRHKTWYRCMMALWGLLQFLWAHVCPA